MSSKQVTKSPAQGNSRKRRNQPRATRRARAGSTHQMSRTDSVPQASASEPKHTSAERRHARREAAIRQDKQQTQLRLLGVGVALILIVAGAIWFFNRQADDSTRSASAFEGIAVAQAPVAANGGLPPAEGPQSFTGTTLGDPDAPVTFVVYSDFRCHYCQSFNAEMLPQIVDDFVRSGQVKVEFRDFVALGSDDFADETNTSARAAHAAMCAAEQDSYIEYHEALFANFSADGSTYTADRLHGYADDLYLDGAEFGACMDGNRYIPALEQAKREGVALGISGTPSFIIDNGNGQPTVTQMTTSGYDLLKKQIQAAIDTAP